MNLVISRGTPTGADLVARDMESAINSVGMTRVERKAFVIGGAQIYREALKRKECKRILLTRILGEFESDTFFPLGLLESGKTEGGVFGEWERRSKGELDRFVGEVVPEGVQEEGGTRYVFEMWERVGELQEDLGDRGS